jgi:hypothetical protein
MLWGLIESSFSVRCAMRCAGSRWRKIAMLARSGDKGGPTIAVAWEAHFRCMMSQIVDAA